MTIIPFRRSQQVQTDAMADTEAASSIPPWPVSPHRVQPVDDGLIEGAGAVVVPAVVLGAVVAAAIVAALWPA